MMWEVSECLTKLLPRRMFSPSTRLRNEICDRFAAGT